VKLIQENVETPTRETPQVTLDGSKLAGEVLAAIGSQAARAVA